LRVKSDVLEFEDAGAFLNLVIDEIFLPVGFAGLGETLSVEGRYSLPASVGREQVLV